MSKNPELTKKLQTALAKSAEHKIGLYRPHSKQKEFHAAGKKFKTRMFLAGNRCGKTFCGCNETSYHLTGMYPEWWEGKRFSHPIKAWAASNTAESTRDILQVEYLGSIFPDEFGTGSIPKDCIGDFTRRQGVANAIDTIKIRHVSGGWSEVTFKSYDQGRAKFQGTSRHIIHLDEEPPMDVFTECATRTMTVSGHILLTMTPLDGMTEVCEHFLHDDTGKIFYVTAGWDDVDHLSEESIEEMMANYPPHEIDARRKGIPTVGRGKIYPFKTEEISCSPFEIPDFYRVAFGLDVGWTNTACIWGAYDPDTDIWYIYHEYKEGELDPIAHSQNIFRIGGKGIPGVCDPAAGKSSQADGQNLLDQYRREGLNIDPADNSVNAGINEVFSRFRTGRLKIFNTCALVFQEINTYARDKNGKVIKRNDHLLDAIRYLLMSGGEVAKAKRSGFRKLFKEKRKRSWITV